MMIIIINILAGVYYGGYIHSRVIKIKNNYDSLLHHVLELTSLQDADV